MNPSPFSPANNQSSEWKHIVFHLITFVRSRLYLNLLSFDPTTSVNELILVVNSDKASVVRLRALLRGRCRYALLSSNKSVNELILFRANNLKHFTNFRLKAEARI